MPRRRPKPTPAPEPIDLKRLPKKARQEIEHERAAEAIMDRRTTDVQRIERDLAHLYLRPVILDTALAECDAKLLHVDKGWMRMRESILPSKVILRSPTSLIKEIRVSRKVADALIKRDGG